MGERIEHKMPTKTNSRSIRRSVAIPSQLVEEALRSAPKDIRGNFNRLVILTLRQYIASQKAAAFEQAMSQMAADPHISNELAAISKEFEPAGLDGF